jgi:hypothetical protein
MTKDLSWASLLTLLLSSISYASGGPFGGEGAERGGPFSLIKFLRALIFPRTEMAMCIDLVLLLAPTILITLALTLLRKKNK